MMMATKGAPAVQVLSVSLHGSEVGVLTRLPGDRTLFAFEDSYLADAQRPTLSLSYKTVSGEIRASERPTRIKVPPFFSNLLPEGPLREYLARIGGVSPEREFFLLWLLGEDLPGAVRVTPMEGEELPPHSLGERSEKTYKADALRFSLAGVQLKFSAVLKADGGLTIPANGVGGSWILKLPSAGYQAVPEMELLGMELAKAVGINTPETRLVKPSHLENLPESIGTLGDVLAVRRFDRRDDGGRVHIEDFAQVFGEFPARKYEIASYEDIARVLWAEAGLEDVVELSRRLAFALLIGNADMHLKNWSVIYENGRDARLAPAYDLVPTVAYLDDHHMALSLGGTKDMYAVDEESFARFANRAGLPEQPIVEAALETAAAVRSSWPVHEARSAAPPALRARITEHMKRLRLGR
jgi:serine/threonine-protein kinase HipA